MCGRFVQYSAPEVYASRFHLDSICATTPHYNLAPTQSVLAIRRTEAGKREHEKNRPHCGQPRQGFSGLMP